MNAKLFTLVNAENISQIFAWGMEITDDRDTEAVIYHRDPDTRKSTIGKHPSAQAALDLWTRAAPMELHWEATPSDVLEMLANLDS